ncbi:MAG TPA: phosphotransferase [Thermoanaerobaculia bacterium]|nr:phosphotransferase [Thermoanaerobaculia bacterium]
MTKNDLIHYLLERGLLDRRAVVDGDVVVVEGTRRHHNYSVIRRQGTGLFIKRMQPDQAFSAQTLQKEAACYVMMESDPALAEIHALMPRFRAYDPDRHLLVLELVAGGENLSELHRRLDAFPEEVARRTGVLLARYHEASRRELLPRASSAIFTGQPPWILSFHLMPPGAMNLSTANGQLMGILQRYPDFAPALDRIRTGWRRDALIHGDMKFDNVVVRAADAASGADDTEPTMHVVDWELADVGDSAWDVASILQAYLTWWIASLPPAADGRPAGAARYPLESIQPAVRAFWDSYVVSRRLEPREADAELERAVSYAGARMLQTVYESLAFASSLTQQAVWQVQASINILQGPRAAATDLLGLPVAAHA